MNPPPIITDAKLLREALAIIEPLLHYGSVGSHSGIGQSNIRSPIPPAPMSVVGYTIIANQYSTGMYHFAERRSALNALQTAGAIQFTEAHTESATVHGWKYRIQILDMEKLKTTAAEISTPKTTDMNTTDIAHDDTVVAQSSVTIT